MSKVRRWEELPREDLKKIPYYRILGWIPQFHEKDIRACRTTPDKVPHEAVSYNKKNTRIWLAGKVIQNTTVMVWMAADLVDGYWKNHRQYGSLDKAIEIENDAMDKPWNEKAQIIAIENQKEQNLILENGLFGKQGENLSIPEEGIGIMKQISNKEFDELSNMFVSEQDNNLFITPNGYKILLKKVKKMFDDMDEKISNGFEPVPSETDGISYLLHKMSKMIIVKGLSDFPNTGDLKPDCHGGDVEHGKCEICGKETFLQRKYWHYPIKCECCGPTHFEMVRHCKDCVPKEPLNTVVSTMDIHGIGKRKITIPTCILITEDR